MQLARQLVTEAMYLAMERASKVKHELRDGELWAMPGASPRHNRLTVKCATQLDRALGAGTCVPLSSDHASSAGMLRATRRAVRRSERMLTAAPHSTQR